MILRQFTIVTKKFISYFIPRYFITRNEEGEVWKYFREVGKNVKKLIRDETGWLLNTHITLKINLSILFDL